MFVSVNPAYNSLTETAFWLMDNDDRLIERDGMPVLFVRERNGSTYPFDAHGNVLEGHLPHVHTERSSRCLFLVPEPFQSPVHTAYKVPDMVDGVRMRATAKRVLRFRLMKDVSKPVCWVFFEYTRPSFDPHFLKNRWISFHKASCFTPRYNGST